MLNIGSVVKPFIAKPNHSLIFSSRTGSIYMYIAQKWVKCTVFVFSGSVETPVRRGGKLNHHFKLNFLRNISTKNYEKSDYV